MRSILLKFLALVLMAPALVTLGALWVLLVVKTFEHFAQADLKLATFAMWFVLVSPGAFVAGYAILREND
jgi:hypothetical protein